MKIRILFGTLQLVCIATSACAGHTVAAKIVTLPSQHVAYTEYIGDYNQHPEAFEVLLDRLKNRAVSQELYDFPDMTKVIILFPDEFNNKPQNRRRLQMAIVVPDGTRTSGQIKTMNIPGGTYGVGRFTVSGDESDAAWIQMFESWLPGSGYNLADGPLLQIMTNDPESHLQQETTIDICIPVSKE